MILVTDCIRDLPLLYKPLVVLHAPEIFLGYQCIVYSELLVDTAMRLFPNGLPDRRQKWVLPEGVLVSEYEHFLAKLFARTVPTPISGFDLSKILWAGFIL